MKKKALLVVIILFAAMLSGCAHRAPAKSEYKFAAIKNPQKMTHGTFSVYKPGDWQEVKKDMMLYYLPAGTIATDTMAEKIIVSVYSVPKKSTATLAELMKSDFAANQKVLSGLKLITSTEAIKFGPLAAREEEYQSQFSSTTINIFQVEARNGNLLYKMQHYCVKDGCKADAIFSEMVGSFGLITQAAVKK